MDPKGNSMNSRWNFETFSSREELGRVGDEELAVVALFANEDLKLW